MCINGYIFIWLLTDVIHELAGPGANVNTQGEGYGECWFIVPLPVSFTIGEENYGLAILTQSRSHIFLFAFLSFRAHRHFKFYETLVLLCSRKKKFQLSIVKLKKKNGINA